jgi:hypothetical protein
MVAMGLSVLCQRQAGWVSEKVRAAWSEVPDEALTIESLKRWIAEGRMWNQRLLKITVLGA